jgi:Trk K+ transport system NAD-binding subunit/nucleotide-binding universal stress UspA family protein
MGMMKVLIAGGSRIAIELIKRLGDSWTVTIIDKSPDRCERISSQYPGMLRVIHGDASSPVVLDEAELSEQDYVLALTGNDQVNLAVCFFAKEKGVKYILSQVNDPEKQSEFKELGVKITIGNALVALSVYHFLEDPRITAISLADGQAEIIEFEVPEHHWFAGKQHSFLTRENWRLLAIARNGDLIFPKKKTAIKAGDRLMILTKPQHFNSVTEQFDTGQLQFPLTYGRELILALLPIKGVDQDQVLHEAFHLARNTKIRNMTILCAVDRCMVQNRVDEIAEGITVELESTEDDLWDRVYDRCAENRIGMVVIPPMEKSFLQSLVKPKLITLAHSLPCPLLVSRGSLPYQKILVPFNDTDESIRALEVAVDLAEQEHKEVDVVVVQESEFIHSEQDENWAESMFLKVRELGRRHKITLGEKFRKGNPVKEILDLARNYDLLIMGSATKEAGIFSLTVGEHLATKAPCSVLIITG